MHTHTHIGQVTFNTLGVDMGINIVDRRHAYFFNIIFKDSSDVWWLEHPYMVK